MKDKDEAERNKRIKENAEISYNQSKLPPRMEAHKKDLEEKKANGLIRSKSQADVESYSF